MELPTHLLIAYGYWLIFGWVLLVWLGIPVPVTPTLLAAGALSSDGDMNFGLSFVAGLTACLIADTTWYWVGRRHGARVLRLLCKVSMEPANCIRKSELSVGQRSRIVLLYVKFIPGVSMLAAPIAGQRGMPFGPFLLYDLAGSTIWLGTLLTAGRLFGKLLAANPHLFELVGRFSGLLLTLGLVAFFAVRVTRRALLLKKLKRARLHPLELKQMLDAGEEVFIVDLRSVEEQRETAHTLPGAFRILPSELAAAGSAIPLDRDVILFCSCPGEAGAASLALKLHKQGIDRVRPLRGGFEEWSRLGLPVEAIA